MCLLYNNTENDYCYHLKDGLVDVYIRHCLLGWPWEPKRNNSEAPVSSESFQDTIFPYIIKSFNYQVLWTFKQNSILSNLLPSARNYTEQMQSFLTCHPMSKSGIFSHQGLEVTKVLFPWTYSDHSTVVLWTGKHHKRRKVLEGCTGSGISLWWADEKQTEHHLGASLNLSLLSA